MTVRMRTPAPENKTVHMRTPSAQNEAKIYVGKTPSPPP
jgi:hypothetical protein